MTTFVCADDFKSIPIHGKRMAISAIALSISHALAGQCLEEFLWPEGFDLYTEKLFPRDLVKAATHLSVAERCVVVEGIAHILAEEEWEERIDA